MATYEDFEKIMDENYGTEHYYTNMFGDAFVYTDGVKQMAEAFHCYWLIDMVESYVPTIKKFVDKHLYNDDLMDSCTMDVVLGVENNKANFFVVAHGYQEPDEDNEDDEGKEIETLIVEQEISYTDMPDGVYKLFLGADSRLVLFLTSEY